ncbi:MAG: DUF3795 domain-containing protein [Patescibacteria group bacterium]
MHRLNSKLIAPCGMNCGICLGYLRKDNTCHGCRDMNRNKYCRKCIIRNCAILKKNKWKFCSSKCQNYPCRRLKNLDTRYKTRYGMSMLENLQFIREQGIRKFVANEQIRWTCKKCHEVVCVHRPACLNCGKK